MPDTISVAPADELARRKPSKNAPGLRDGGRLVFVFGCSALGNADRKCRRRSRRSARRTPCRSCPVPSPDLRSFCTRSSQRSGQMSSWPFGQQHHQRGHVVCGG
jgi:hypothetical protein